MFPSFESYFEALWGFAPYPWQSRLAAYVLTTGRWPHTIDVPTGAGKTASIDVALYALAHDASHAPEARQFPRRIVMVVDRKTIVDQGFERAVALRDKLSAAPEGSVLGQVAGALRSLMADRSVDGGPEEPVAVTLLRGGMPRDDGWARRPDQPLIALSTVDQVGSRLLFRGYGVRPRMRSIHAGLLGSDCLFLLDEVHLAQPFEQSLTAIETRWRTWTDPALPQRWQVVRLSATSGAIEPFGLSDADFASASLTRRLEAVKTVHMEEVSHKTHNKKGVDAQWVGALAKAALKSVAGGVKALCVVVNRVDTALALAQALTHDSKCEAKVVLLTGRMRAPERAQAIARVLEAAAPGRPTDSSHATAQICVATQCIEAGADLDFDAMITEVASLDALVQRFGRVNRTGLRTPGELHVLCPKLDSDDPIYGTALVHTAQWLAEQGPDWPASFAGLRERLPSASQEAYPPKADAAVIVPAHLDLLAQTEPEPAVAPEVAPYLHGFARGRAEVRVVWRADVDPTEPALSERRLAAVAPATWEGISLPLGVVRAWLRGDTEPPYADAGSEPDAESKDAWRDRDSTPQALMSGPDGWRPVTARDLRPDTTLVVPASAGGLWRGNFASAERTPVSDQGDLARTLAGGIPVFRLDKQIYGERPSDDADRAWPAAWGNPPAPPANAELTSLREAQQQARAWLKAAPAGLHPLLDILRAQAKFVSFEAVDHIWVLRGRRLNRESLLDLASELRESPRDTALTASDNSSQIGSPYALTAHLADVRAWASDFARVLGLSDDLAHDLSLAAYWHDLGKADPRFQTMLYGGDDIRALSSEALAKSEYRDQDARRRAAEAAHLPGHFRHEMASVALLTSSEAGRRLLAQASDPDLVLHLVASHHGFARPFAPIEDHTGQPEDLEVQFTLDGIALQSPADHRQDAADSGVSDRFFALQRRYGWWGLCWLESILRLADARASESLEALPREDT